MKCHNSIFSVLLWEDIDEFTTSPVHWWKLKYYSSFSTIDIFVMMDFVISAFQSFLPYIYSCETSTNIVLLLPWWNFFFFKSMQKHIWFYNGSICNICDLEYIFAPLIKAESNYLMHRYCIFRKSSIIYTFLNTY